MSKSAKKTYLNIFIGLLLFFISFILLKPVNGLTQTGVNLLSAFIMVVYWWVSVGTTWTTIIVVPILALTGAMSYQRAVSSGLGNYMTLFIIMSGMMNVALLKSGCIERFILWFITRKIVKNRPYMFIFLYMTAIYLVSLIMAGSTVCIIMLPIIKGICEELNYGKDDRFSKTLYMLANWVSLLGFVATPIGHSTAMMCISTMEALLNYYMSFGQWMAVGIPVSLVWFALIFITVRLFYKIDIEKFINYDVEGRRKTLEDMGPLDKRGKISALIFFVCVALFFVPDILAGIMPWLKTFVDTVGTVSVVIFGVVLLCVLHIDGKPLLDFRSAVYDIEWGPLFMNISMYAISSAITSDNTGISLFIQNIFAPMAAGITGWAPYVLLVTFAMIFVTQFMACRTIMVIGIMVAAPIAIDLGINPVAISVICCYTANMGLMTPPASGGAAVILSTDYMTPADGFTLGWFALPQGLFIGLISYILINAVYPFCYAF